MPNRPLLPFPILRNTHFSGLQPLPGTILQLEVNADCLPISLHACLHITWEANGKTEHLACDFLAPLHPSYAFGNKGQDDDILERLGGVEAATAKASSVLARKGELHMKHLGFLVEFSLNIPEVFELRGIMVRFDRLSQKAFEKAPATRREIPPPRESSVKPKKTREQVDLDAARTVYGRRPKRKAG